jgi:hypothetical protein
MTVNKIILLPIVALLLSMQTGCKPYQYSSANFSSSAGELSDIYKLWLERGQPTNFTTADFFGPQYREFTNQFFVFTNTATAGSVVYHCHFGALCPHFPPGGVLAITDEGPIIWIRDRDGKVTLSPEVNGIEP